MMSDPGETNIVCEGCGGEVKDDDAACPHCGALFTDLLVCSQHPSHPASGVCVICSEPCCDECGTIVNNRFVCLPHAKYEIREGMARVFWNRGTLEAQLATNCLEQAGLHPFTIADLDVYVSFSEVPRAEKALRETGLFTS